MQTNGQPVWKKLEAPIRWLYLAPNDTWCIADVSFDEAKNGALCKICSGQNANGQNPDQMKTWRRYNGTAFVDDDISVSTVQAQPSQPLRNSAAVVGNLGHGLFGWEPLSDDHTGMYIVIESTTASSTCDLGGPTVANLVPGTVVTVVEVVRSTDCKIMRARIENPVGWLTVLDLQDGKRAHAQRIIGTQMWLPKAGQESDMQREIARLKTELKALRESQLLPSAQPPPPGLETFSDRTITNGSTACVATGGERLEEAVLIRFLPKEVDGDTTLARAGDGVWRVVDSSPWERRTLAYRKSKDEADKDGSLPAIKFGAVIQGIDEGDWVRVEVRCRTAR